MNLRREKIGKIKTYYLSDKPGELSRVIIDYFWNKKKHPEAVFNLYHSKPKGDLFILQWQNVTYYIKYTRNRLWKHKVRNVFRPPSRYLKISYRLSKIGIQVAEPVLAFSFRKNLLTHEGVFVTKAVSGVPLSEYLRKESTNARDIQLIKELGRLWGILYKNSFLHSDPGTDNFLIKIKDRAIGVYLVDMDGIYPLPVMVKSMFMNRFSKFSFCIYYELLKEKKQQLTSTERVAFYREFLTYSGLKLSLKELISIDKELFLERVRDKKRRKGVSIPIPKWLN
ncbi:hypothetical protein QA601_11135 [Chitinispirillales bacterium ANBcel5]|uniref:hypothetical protein n=1 Tax=Cellulosispirillum alkaliphilum TaxID=3039283 RepID=UPI002A5747DB|nr:hypothetical protein [Chitinispirillales bacterium ANBcel5]